MLIVSKLLITFGVLGVVLALNMNVSLPGAEVVNIHLISERQNYLFLSVAIFIAGIVIYVSAKKSAAKSDTESSSTGTAKASTEELQRHKAAIVTFWNSKPSSSKLLLVAATIAGISTMLKWSTFSLSSSDISMSIGGSHISFVTLAVMIGCWGFPLYRVVSDLSITKRQLIIPASILSIWMAKEIFSLFRFADTISEVATSTQISMGAGMWLAIVSTCIYAWVAVTYKPFADGNNGYIT